MQCVFCAIASGKIPTKRIYEDEEVIAVLDINPRSKASCIVFPKEHYLYPEERPVLSQKVFSIAVKISATIRQLFKPVFVSIAYLPSKSPHFNLKILPYYENEIPLVERNPLRLDEKELEQMAEMIKRKLNSEKPKKKEKKTKTENIYWIKRELELA